MKFLRKYKGLSDFFLNATKEEKKKLLLEVAKKANEDQMKLYKKMI